MGLLEKRNPRATRRTVTRAGILGAGWFFLFSLIMLSISDFPFWGWVFMLAFMTACGAVTGAAMEWQLTKESDVEDAEPLTRPDRDGT
jgi:hypothetical protein